MQRQTITGALASVALLGLGLSGSTSAQCQHWTPFPMGPSNVVFTILSHDDGSGPMLYVGGDFNGIYNLPPQLFSDRIARWNGSTWLPVGWPGFNDVVLSLAEFDSGNGPELYAGGWFDRASGVDADGIAKWDGAVWSSLPDQGVEHIAGAPVTSVEAMTVYDDGSGLALFLCGQFRWAGIVLTNYVAKWDGTNFYPLGTGLGPVTTTTRPRTMAVHDDGTGPALYVGGQFTSAGGIPVNRVARWDGSSWSALGVGLYEVLDMVSFDDGHGPALFVAGVSADTSHVGVLKWTGSAWLPVGGFAPGGVYSVDVFEDETGPALYMAGGFTSVGGVSGIRRAARWDGQQWRPLGYGLNDIGRTMTVHDDGSGSALYFGGQFYNAGVSTSYAISAWRRCTEPVDTVCFGDGTVTACPCTPNATPGNGCPNSVHPGGARLDATGAPVPDTLSLQASTVPPSTVCLFFQGDARFEPYQDMAHGDGLRCAGGQQRRLYTKFASSGLASAPEAGDPSVSQRAIAQGDTLPPGSVRYYQVFYRDPNPTFCVAAATWNLTNGLRVVW